MPIKVASPLTKPFIAFIPSYLISSPCHLFLGGTSPINCIHPRLCSRIALRVTQTTQETSQRLARAGSCCLSQGWRNTGREWWHWHPGVGVSWLKLELQWACSGQSDATKESNTVRLTPNQSRKGGNVLAPPFSPPSNLLPELLPGIQAGPSYPEAWETALEIQSRTRERKGMVMGANRPRPSRKQVGRRSSPCAQG